MLGAEPDDQARHAGVAAHRLNALLAGGLTSTARFTHQRPVAPLNEGAVISATW